MELVTGKLNNVWLESIHEKSKRDCIGIKAAIAYVNDDPKLLKHCFETNLPLTLWCRYDHTVPVSLKVLEKFLKPNVINQHCKMVPEVFHPKVIWWREYGAYIGSANLTDNGWMRNIECGIFMSESELETHGMLQGLQEFFEQIDEHSRPLTDEVYNHLKNQERINFEMAAYRKSSSEQFQRKRIIPPVTSLISVNMEKTEDKRKQKFLDEWNKALTYLRKIQEIVSAPKNRPKWIDNTVSKGVQADQFLHAYYYNKVKEGRKYPFEEFYQRNKDNPEQALKEAISWWASLEAPPSDEDKTIYEWAPLVFSSLSNSKVKTLNEEQFTKVCKCVHAIRDHATKMDNMTLGLPKGFAQKSKNECIELFAKYLWSIKTDEGYDVLDVIDYVLYEGTLDDTPKRLYNAVNLKQYKIPHFGISSLGEIVGWAMPDKFPPRNGRTSKALRSLGFDVKVHSG